MPFVTAGDPDLEFTAAVLRELVGPRCSLCELGIPYSDPIADGPVIQASYTRALAKKIKLAEILEMTRRLTPALKPPLVTMVSYAIVYRHGPERYVADAQAAGMAGAIVPDLPVEEAAAAGPHLPGGRFQPDPTGHADHASRAGLADRGNVDRLSLLRLGHRHHRRTGRTAAGADRERRTGCAQQTPLPICIGFGISGRSTCGDLAPVADGLIVGSAIVRRMAAAESKPREAVLADVGNFVSELLAALQS